MLENWSLVSPCSWKAGLFTAASIGNWYLYFQIVTFLWTLTLLITMQMIGLKRTSAGTSVFHVARTQISFLLGNVSFSESAVTQTRFTFMMRMRLFSHPSTSRNTGPDTAQMAGKTDSLRMKKLQWDLRDITVTWILCQTAILCWPAKVTFPWFISTHQVTQGQQVAKPTQANQVISSLTTHWIQAHCLIVGIAGTWDQTGGMWITLGGETSSQVVVAKMVRVDSLPVCTGNPGWVRPSIVSCLMTNRTDSCQEPEVLPEWMMLFWQRRKSKIHFYTDLIPTNQEGGPGQDLDLEQNIPGFSVPRHNHHRVQHQTRRFSLKKLHSMSDGSWTRNPVVTRKAENGIIPSLSELVSTVLNGTEPTMLQTSMKGLTFSEKTLWMMTMTMMLTPLALLG